MQRDARRAQGVVQLGNARLCRACREDIQPRRGGAQAKRRDVAEPHLQCIGQRCQRKKATAGQHLKQGEAIIRSARHQISLPVDFGAGKRGSTGKPAAQIIEHMRCHAQRAVRFDFKHR